MEGEEAELKQEYVDPTATDDINYCPPPRLNHGCSRTNTANGGEGVVNHLSAYLAKKVYFPRPTAKNVVCVCVCFIMLV